MQLIGGRLVVRPPVCGPDPQDLPAKMPQDLFANLVAILRGGRSMIGRAVAFDASKIRSGLIRMDDPQIDSEC